MVRKKYYMKKRRIIMIISLIVVCALGFLVLGIIQYNNHDGKSTESRELIIGDVYKDSEIYSEFILDDNGEHIISAFYYDACLAIAYFRQDNSGRYQMINAKVSNNDEECIILEVGFNDKEYYVGAINQDNLKNALITYTYADGEQSTVEKEVSGKGIFLCERPEEVHSIMVEYRR